jgi:hypothetical protein
LGKWNMYDISDRGKRVTRQASSSFFEATQAAKVESFPPEKRAPTRVSVHWDTVGSQAIK